MSYVKPPRTNQTPARQHYTEIKQGIDECLEEINNVHDYEPVDAGGCDAMLGKILSIKEKE